MNRVISVARVMPRVLTACAVMIGLVFMHSLGAAIGTGCPGGAPSTATSAALPAMGEGHDVGMVEAMAIMPGPDLASTPRAGHSSVCDSTPPRGDQTGRLAQAATEPVEPGGLGQTPGIRRAGGAIPRAGPALLISLGVSRT